MGDKTTCGGTVQEADNRVIMFGRNHVREGDRVTCGKSQGVYRIIGGISYIESHGRRVAGSLDSISSCPCRARLIPSLNSATYQSER
ncbi:MAG: PAAR domain-containing protein, partial [Pseudomonas sp.]